MDDVLTQLLDEIRALKKTLEQREALPMFLSRAEAALQMGISAKTLSRRIAMGLIAIDPVSGNIPRRELERLEEEAVSRRAPHRSLVARGPRPVPPKSGPTEAEKIRAAIRRPHH